jgi:hypothetical protein
MKANKRNYICVQSSYYPTDRLNYNEQSKYIADNSPLSAYDRIKSIAKELLQSI